MTIRLFHLGVHAGWEIDRFLEDAAGLGEIEVFGVEANPVLYESAARRFSGDCRIKLFHFAAGSQDGEASLYLARVGDLGSSIYSDKPNVRADGAVKVAQKRVSTWLGELGLLPKSDDALCVLYSNIEGAEWGVLQDLSSMNLLTYFDLYLGSYDDWCGDMKKVPSLSSHVPEAHALMRRFDLSTARYTGKPGTQHLTPSLRPWLQRRLNSSGGGR